MEESRNSAQDINNTVFSFLPGSFLFAPHSSREAADDGPSFPHRPEMLF